MNNHWSMVDMDDIFTIARGGSPRPIQKFLTDDPNGVNWIMIGDASKGSKYITSTKKRIIPEGVKRSRMVNEGDFLLTNSMSFGKPYIMKTTGCIHDGWLVLSPKSSEIDVDYFYHLLGSRFMYLEFTRRAAGAIVKNLNIKLVKNVQVPLPPLAEQQRIAAVLDKADALRTKRRAALAKLDTLLQSTFLHMFGDPVTNPMRWEVRKIEDIAEVKGGLQVSRKRKDHPIEIPYLRVANVYRDHLKLDEIKTIRINKRELERTSLETGDILLVEGHGNPNEIGRTAVWDGSINPCVHQNHLIRVQANRKKILPTYMSNYLNSEGGRRQLIKSGKTTSGLNTISSRQVRGTNVLIPPLAVQQEYLDHENSIQTMKEKHSRSLEKLDNLFHALQQRAFKGDL